jgi:hypothetical protein
MKLALLTMKNLREPKMYAQLLNLWYQGYYSIPKLTKMLPSQLDYTSLSTFKESLINEGVRALGGVEIINMGINQTDIKKSTKYLIKSYMGEFNQVEPLSPVLQQEFDAKIDEIYNNELLLLE